MSERFSEENLSKRDVPSFIEPRPPLISNPFMRPRPQKGTNLMELYEEDSECEEPELVQVYLRLKPSIKSNNLYEVRSDRCLITSLDTTTAGHGRRTQHNVSKMYTFSHIFRAESSQKEIFDHVVKENLMKLPEGHSFTLLTYGASGSGKTYTLMGTVASPGLVPRSLEFLFKIVDVAQLPTYKPVEGVIDKLNYAKQEYELQWVKRLKKVAAPLRDKYRRMSSQLYSDITVSQLDISSPTRHYVWVSFIEIYNEGIYDLLAARDKGNAAKLAIREDSNGNVYVKGASQAFVRSGEEAYDVMVAGKHQLQVAATGVHAHSSRSHCIFTITMVTETDGGCVTSCVRLCDLAGSERVSRTRNTGARMQESCAINTSLHVLERCLHTLRRKKQFVPYRESKLTRLLGAGLSGTRGEAVSMVVTLNPSPEYAHETRHVLQLAAVARDIQINNTIAEYASTLESSTQDTTVSFSSEVMKLRADNERLHFELVQAHARIKELVASMEERQLANADTMRELVEEAKDMTKQYYEAQLNGLRNEIKEMAQEYEYKLNELSSPVVTGTPSRNNKIKELMTENAILEEKLTAERLARARAENEMQHLRACIEERDGKEEEDSENEDVISLSESGSETDEDDLCHESLEPTFKKVDINRSRIKRQSIMSTHSERNSSHNRSDTTEDSVLGIINDTLKDESNNSIDDVFTDDVLVTCKKASYVRESDNEIKEEMNSQSSKDSVVKETTIRPSEDFEDRNVSIEVPQDLVESNEFNKESPQDLVQSKETNIERSQDLADIKLNLKGRYFFERDDNTDINKKHLRGTYCVSKLSDTYLDSNESDKGNNDTDSNKNLDEKEDLVPDNIQVDNIHTKSFINKILQQRKSSKGNNSLTQFEQIELATKMCDEENKKKSEEFGKNILKEKKRFFHDDDDDDVNHKNFNKFQNKDDFVKIPNDNGNIDGLKCDEDKRSIVKDEIANEYEPNMIKKLLGKNLAHYELPSANTDTFRPSSDSVDIFESPHYVTQNIKSIQGIRKSIDNVVLTGKSDTEKKIIAEIINLTEPETHALETLEQPSTKQEESEKTQCKNGNEKYNIVVIQEDIVESIDIDKDSLETFKVPSTKRLGENNNTISTETVKNIIEQDKKPKLEPYTDLSQNTTVDNTLEEFESIYKNISVPRATEFDLLVSQETQNVIDPKESDIKYNLRKKEPRTRRTRKANSEEEVKNEEVILESHSKRESKRPKRNLRLRRLNTFEIENAGNDGEDKLKDIVNLQSEFSDVTMDRPAPNKVVVDIPSPRKGVENLPPMGIQSCPSKSVTRSRRKLFTPRAEPLEESLTQTGDSNERVCVPRPSYHRPRARRKL